MSLVLSAELDRQRLNGDGISQNLAGMFSRLTNPTAPSALADFGYYAGQHAGGVDGLWARGISEVKILVGPDTYRHSAQTFQTTSGSAGEVSAAAYAEARTGGWSTNARMPAAVGNVGQAILYRMGRSFLNMSDGYMRTAVQPIWLNSIDITDIYTDSASATTHFTMHVLLGDVLIVQPDAYAQISYQVA